MLQIFLRILFTTVHAVDLGLHKLIDYSDQTDFDVQLTLNL